MLKEYVIEVEKCFIPARDFQITIVKPENKPIPLQKIIIYKESSSEKLTDKKVCTQTKKRLKSNDKVSLMRFFIV